MTRPGAPRTLAPDRSEGTAMTSPQDPAPSAADPLPAAVAGDPTRLAAIDLGSNSFHLLVANY
ncbi:MAG: hypothetical protein WBY88_16115, partial [Desulfosarcina sp.]